MMFFQLALLAGYFYAHLLASKVPAKKQPIIHLVLLGLSFLLLPLGLPADWQPEVSFEPSLQILSLLAISIGLPFLLIAATAPLLQHWFASSFPNKSPFRLYALSNLGSLIALLSYPALVEPSLTLQAQSITWSVLYGFLTVGILACGYVFSRQIKPLKEKALKSTKTDNSKSSVTITDRILWMGLSACGSIMLLAMTNHISRDLAVVPFLWILPLSLYLISFIIAFERDSWYRRPLWIGLFIISLGLMLKLMFTEFDDDSAPLSYQISIFSLTLFAICMVCHGELARRKSAVRNLTSFYLYISVGGALGGAFVNLIAPFIFTGFWELHFGLFATVGLVGASILFDRKRALEGQRRIVFLAIWPVFMIGLIAVLILQIQQGREDSIYHTRSFFGVMSVDEDAPGDYHGARTLYHGSIEHGIQLTHPSRRSWGTAYYTSKSGISQAWRQHSLRQADPDGLDVGVIGLGVGTLAYLGTSRDRITFYEIDEEVEDIARQFFSFLQLSKAQIKVVLGDARISIQRELSRPDVKKFDLLVVDAFSGDSVPIHLLTEEAFKVYADRLEANGVLAIHITNWYVDLQDVVRNSAAAVDMEAVLIEHYADKWYESSSDWIIASRDPSLLHSLTAQGLTTQWRTFKPRPVHWTDDFSNLLEVLDWH